MKAVLEPIGRFLLLKPWWRKLLVAVPATICVVLIIVGLRPLEAALACICHVLRRYGTFGLPSGVDDSQAAIGIDLPPRRRPNPAAAVAPGEGLLP